MALYQAYSSTVFTTNTAGAQLFVSGPNSISGVNAPQAQGLVHSLTISADSTAQTITLYDGTSTGGTVRFKVVTPTTTPVLPIPIDIQFNVGCFIVISGGTSVVDTVTWV